jgi:hypothetical protein
VISTRGCPGRTGVRGGKVIREPDLQCPDRCIRGLPSLRLVALEYLGYLPVRHARALPERQRETLLDWKVLDRGLSAREQRWRYG